MNTLYKATVIDNLYINQESRNFIDKMQAEGYKYIIKSKNEGYFELEFMVANEIFDGIKNCLIWKQDKIYYNLFNEFLGLYYHGRHHYPNDQYAFKKN